MTIPDFVDLSSDTATRPSIAMREAMAKAEVGDEQRLEDPTILELIERTRTLLGKEAGLFLPTGTMCNLIAVKTHTNPGDAVFLGHNCHILRCETGAAALVSGVVLDTVPSANGCFDGETLEKALYSRNNYTPNPSLVCVEQSHNFGGGAIWPLAHLQEIRRVADRHGLKVHMDGARLLNAVVASGVNAADFAACCDTVWIDFTKGLGAPIGSVLCGTQEFIDKARRYKHMFGGAMRQAGIAAAGCIYALDHNVERLDDDHRRAQELASFLEEQTDVVVEPVDTNLIFFTIGQRLLSEFQSKLESRGVRMSQVGNSVRAVTHLDINDEDIAKAKAVLSEVL